MVDDEVLEELLKEVGRALVEADVNIKVRCSVGGQVLVRDSPPHIAFHSSTPVHTTPPLKPTKQVVAGLRKAIKEKVNLSEAAAGAFC